jgi:hypothetical protein
MPTVPRLPDDLFTATLPDWVKLVWLQIRKTQGNGPWAFAHFGTYAEACGKHSTQGSQAVKLLCELGWLARHPNNPKRLRCLVPGMVEVDEPSTSGADDEEDWVDEPSTDVDEPSTHLDQSSTRVDHSSTASEPSQGIRTRNPEKESVTVRRERKKNPKVERTPLPDWLPPPVWEEWEQFRAEIGKPVTPTAHNRQLTQLARYRDEGHDPAAILLRAIGNGWTGLYPDRSTLARADVQHAAAERGGGSAEVGGTNGAAVRAGSVARRGEAVHDAHRGHAPEPRRESASDRRSNYGYDDARRDVRSALAPLLGGGPDAGGREDE